MRIEEKKREIKQAAEASLISFINSNSIFKEAFKIIGSNTGATFQSVGYFDSQINRFINFFQIKTIKELEDVLNKNKKNYWAFVTEYSKGLVASELTQSVATYYLQHFLAAKGEDENYVKSYLSFGDVRIGAVPLDFIDIIKKIKTT